MRCDSVFQRSGALVGERSGEMPCFRAKKTVGAPLDFMSAIQTAAILQSMKIITHNRGVICPAFRRRRHIVVPVKKPNPLAGFVDSRHADQFRTETRHNDAKAVLFVSKNIQMPTVTVLLCVRKLHRRRACICRAFDSLAPATSPFGLPVHVARRPPAPFCETPVMASDTDALQ